MPRKKKEKVEEKRPQKIRISMRAYDHRLLDKSAGDLALIVKKTGGKLSGPVPLPVRRQRFTVLRSPHVDKKSREQFEIRVHKRLLEITVPTPRTVDALKRLDIPSGVEVEIKL